MYARTPHKAGLHEPEADHAVLRFDEVTVTYPDGDQTVTALDRVGFEVPPGNIAAIIGESGSGKSTLLSVAAGLSVPDSGTVAIDTGTEVVDLARATETERARVRRNFLGVVFQRPNLLPALTVSEQLVIADDLSGRRHGAKKAGELLDFVGLNGMENRRVHQLSGGQQQRVNIARALMGNPRVLLADEPTSALDHKLSQEIMDLLRKVTDRFGLATVLVTHDESLLNKTDQVHEMRDGKLSKK